MGQASTVRNFNLAFGLSAALTQLAESLPSIKQARVLGFEPRIVDPKSTALPLGHTRMLYEKRLGGNHFNPSSGLKAISSLCVARIV